MDWSVRLGAGGLVLPRPPALEGLAGFLLPEPQLPRLGIENSKDLAHPCLCVLWPQVLGWGRWCRGGCGMQVWPPCGPHSEGPRSGLDSDSPGRGSQHFTLVHRICPLLPPIPHPGPPGHPFLLLTHQGLLSATRRDSGWGLFLASLLPAASPPAPSCPAFPGVRSPLPHLTARLPPCPPSHRPPPPHPRWLHCLPGLAPWSLPSSFLVTFLALPTHPVLFRVLLLW